MTLTFTPQTTPTGIEILGDLNAPIQMAINFSMLPRYTEIVGRDMRYHWEVLGFQSYGLWCHCIWSTCLWYQGKWVLCCDHLHSM